MVSSSDRVILKGSASTLGICSSIPISITTSVLTLLIILLFFSFPARYYYLRPSPYYDNYNNSTTPPYWDSTAGHHISSPLSFTATSNDDNGVCNLFKGQWVEEADPKLLLYNSSSCGSIPASKNCFLHGRPDSGFLRWRWKPVGCGRLDRFDPRELLEVVRGKRVAFVGDSVARNQVESLLCMLATVEVPVDVYKDAKDRSRTWYFAGHNFTLMVLWTKFLVKAKERGINGKPTGSFDLQIDQVDDSWASQLSDHDQQDQIIVISASQWFFRENYLYRQGHLIGCTFCGGDTSRFQPTNNLTRFQPSFAIGTALRTSLLHIIDTINLNNSNHHHHVIIVRTISPSHFENGTWKTGGSCNRQRPFTLLHHYDDDNKELEMIIPNNNYSSTDAAELSDQWEVRKVQMEEVAKASQRAAATSNCKSPSDEQAALCKSIAMEALDITLATMMRPDGHPGHYWRDNKNKNGYNDCVHWCLPGPIDTWNYLLLPLLRKNYS